MERISPVRLAVENVSISFGKNRILSGLTMSASEGEFIALLGPSGSGKSTLLRIVVGEFKHYTGQISGPTRIGYAPQRAPLLPWLSVFDNLILAKSEDQTASSTSSFGPLVDRLLKRAGLENARELRPPALSGGMRGRVNILRAFLMRSNVLLMDEPFVGLDAVTRERLHTLTLELWSEEKPATIFVTHDIDEALRIANRIVVLGRPEEGSGIRLDIANEIQSSSRLRTDAEYQKLHKKIFEALR